MKFCPCMGVRKFSDAIADLRDEIVELVEVKSLDEFMDEWSDVSWGIGRLVAGLFGKVYFRVPGDRRHASKIEKRMVEQGCVRSANQISKGNTCL